MYVDMIYRFIHIPPFFIFSKKYNFLHMLVKLLKQTCDTYIIRKKSLSQRLCLSQGIPNSLYHLWPRHPMITSPASLRGPLCEQKTLRAFSGFFKVPSQLLNRGKWQNFLLLKLKMISLCFFPVTGETVVNVLDFKKDAGLWHGMFAVSYTESRALLYLWFRSLCVLCNHSISRYLYEI